MGAIRVISKLSQLLDVNLLGASDGDPLVYDASSGGAKKGSSGSSSPIETVNTVAASGAATTIPDVTTATIDDITLTAACTLTFPTAAAGKSFTLVLRQDGTGSRTVTWPAGIKWAAGSAPTLTTTASAVDVLAFVCVDGSHWLGFVSGQDMR